MLGLYPITRRLANDATSKWRRCFNPRLENIVVHLRNVVSSKELDAEATIKDFLVVQSEGQQKR